MCGITGYFSIDRDVASDDVIRRMTRAVSHRGPDDEGIVLLNTAAGLVRNLRTDATAPGVVDVVPAGDGTAFPHRIALGHRRFSIIDLSPNAHQPFWSTDGSICVVFNGEIYNYVELRVELEQLGHHFRTTSDTEILAEAFLEWGTDAFSRFVGFWALSLYDARVRRLLLARDRLGKASLYIGPLDGKLWWASEIKGLLAGAGPAIQEVRDQAVSDFLIYSWRDVYEKTFFAKITTFPRASFAWIEPDGSYEPVRYWSVPASRMSENDISPDEAARGLRERLSEAVRVRLRADVPVGFELSGGLDSSTLVALGASQRDRISVFTIAFPGTSADEEPFARKVHERYAANTTYNIVQHQTEDFLDHADYIVGLMDEPFHSPNVLSIQEIWRQMQTQGIRVSIKGDAGDELFAGYPGVYHAPYLWDLLERGELRRLHQECTSFSEQPSKPFSPAYLRRIGRVLAAGSRLYGGSPRRALARARAMRRVASAGFRSRVGPQSPKVTRLHDILLERIGDWQINQWMRIGNLVSMGVPMEIRAPFLDHRVVEYAFTLPTGYLIRDGWLKWILRHAMKDHLPPEIIWRTNKVGFPFPYRHWLTSSKERFFSMIEGTDVPYVDLAVLASRYDQLVERDPLLVWRFIMLSLWWKKCILGEQLVDHAMASAR